MKKWVIIANIIFFLIGLGSILLALTSVMLFDSPGSEKNPYVWIMFFSSIALPFTCFGSVITSLWILFKSHNNKKALWVALIPCIWIITLTTSMILLQVFCQGYLACF